MKKRYKLKDLGKDSVKIIFTNYYDMVQTFMDLNGEKLVYKELATYLRNIGFGYSLDEVYYKKRINRNVTKYLYDCIEGNVDDNIEELEEFSRFLFFKTAEKLQRIGKALFSEYNPIHNFDRTEENTETHSGIDKNKTTTLNKHLNDDVVENERAGLNSIDYVGDSKITSKDGDRENVNDSALTYGHTITHENKMSGNIGTTKTQEMIEDEINLRSENDFMDIVFNEFDKVLLLQCY